MSEYGDAVDQSDPIKDHANTTMIHQPDPSADLAPGTRLRNKTAKGAEYEIELYEQKFKSAVSTWRKQFNRALVMISDMRDQDLIKAHRDAVQDCVDAVGFAFQYLKSIKENVSIEEEKFETMEIQHQELMQKISSQLQEIENIRYEVASSKGSSNSVYSSHSRSSGISKISNLSTRKAALRAKLKYLDIESKYKTELQKIKTIKELEIAGAEEEALKEVLSDDGISLPLPERDKAVYIKEYVEKHSKSGLESDAETNVSVSSSTTPSTCTTDVTHTTVTVPSCTTVGTSDIRLSTVHPSGTSESLNPHAVTFVPSLTPQVSTQSTWIYKDAHPIMTKDLGTDTTDAKSRPDTKCTGANVPDNSTQQGLIELAKSLADQVNLSRLPPPEPNVFSGDPIQYPSWKAAFNTLIDQRNIPAGERIYYLKRYLGGSVRQVVENYFLLSTDDAYDKARALLDERYGDPFIIANAFRSKLDSWPKINVRDPNALLKFSDFLKQCLSAMQTITSLHILNDNQENRKMLTKIPDWLVNRWNRLVAQRKEQTAEFPPFKDFVEFVAKEAKIACDPVTSPMSLKGSSSAEHEKGHRVQQPHDHRKTHGGRALLADVAENRESGHSPSEAIGSLYCVLCKGKHDLDTCKSFLSKSLPDRKTFLKEKSLCFGCLRSGHVSRRCRQRKKCTTCSKFHPTSLHGDTLGTGQRSKEVNSDSNGTGSSAVSHEAHTNNAILHVEQTTRAGVAFLGGTREANKCSMIVPVYISHCDSPESEILIYALLDTQSDTTFVLEDTCNALGLTGIDVKLSLSTMYAENRVVESQKIKGLSVRGFNSSLRISLPPAYTRNIMPANREHIPTPEMARMWPHLEPIADNLMELNPCQIGLLIGYNCSRCLIPREVIASEADGPFGQKTDLGWGIVGIIDPCYETNDPIGLSHRIITREVPSPASDTQDSVMFSLKTKVKEVVSSDIIKLMEQDIIDPTLGQVAYSQEDMKFLTILEKGIKFDNGHYELPLPFRNGNPALPNNKSIALKRLNALTRRFERDAKFRQDYFAFMQNLVDNGHAERVTGSDEESNDNSVWYIPHHGVYHPQKPDKIRVVFDCSASFENESLNSHLLQGPDLTNKLIGVLCRFRQEPVAVMCDIEQMFYQFHVSPEHRNYLRFLWWDSADFTKQPVEYRMTVHLFGATSSPGCANFGLKRIAADNEEEFGKETADFLRHDFYVDDGLKSLPNTEKTLSLIDNSIAMCRKGGVRLCKFVSNQRDILDSLAPDDRAKDLKDVNMVSDKLPLERALGITWCIESDSFKFRIILKDRPLTRRGILSSVSSLYDPLGFIAPVVLAGKQILQHMCIDGADWDDPLPESLREKWEKWRASLECLHSLEIERCIKPKGFGEPVVTEMHHFSDASLSGYGQCSYIRLKNNENHVACAFVMGKSRVIPVKPVTVPRLELTAALMSVKVASLLEQELDYDNITHVYWTDSKVVLGYISNEARRFHIYVANRVQQIKEHTDTTQWHYVKSAENPADIASRGMHANELVEHSMWLKGPEFLWNENLPQDESETFPLQSDDPELKQKSVKSFACETASSDTFSLLDRLAYFSSWYKAKRAVALCLRYINKLRQHVSNGPPRKAKGTKRPNIHPLTVDEMKEAELLIIKHAQALSFKGEISTLRANRVIGIPSGRKEHSSCKANLNGKSALRRLDPFLDTNGILRIGGRVQSATIPDELKYPIVLPRKGLVTNLVASHFHHKTLHQGRGMTVNEIRNNGFWIISCSAVVSNLIMKCVVCRRLRGSLQVQKMANLPADRLEPAPPFTYCAVDFFGPFFIKEGRKELKRYGVLFTCMLCRAVHVETSNSLETDSFINCLRRFMSIRGPIRQLRSDRGTNFVGAERELKMALNELDDDKLRQFLLEENCDFDFKMNFPSSSHMGGVWERQIRSIRNVLASLLLKHGTQLDDESLRTFLSESAAIVNSRPLTVDNINDPLSTAPLTPNHLLTLKSKVILPPPGNFPRTSLYSM